MAARRHLSSVTFNHLLIRTYWARPLSFLALTRSNFHCFTDAIRAFVVCAFFSAFAAACSASTFSLAATAAATSASSSWLPRARATIAERTRFASASWLCGMVSRRAPSSAVSGSRFSVSSVATYLARGFFTLSRIDRGMEVKRFTRAAATFARSMTSYRSFWEALACEMPRASSKGKQSFALTCFFAAATSASLVAERGVAVSGARDNTQNMALVRFRWRWVMREWREQLAACKVGTMRGWHDIYTSVCRTSGSWQFLHKCCRVGGNCCICLLRGRGWCWWDSHVPCGPNTWGQCSHSSP